MPRRRWRAGGDRQSRRVGRLRWGGDRARSGSRPGGGRRARSAGDHRRAPPLRARRDGAVLPRHHCHRHRLGRPRGGLRRRALSGVGERRRRRRELLVHPAFGAPRRFGDHRRVDRRGQPGTRRVAPPAARTGSRCRVGGAGRRARDRSAPGPRRRAADGVGRLDRALGRGAAGARSRRPARGGVTPRRRGSGPLRYRPGRPERAPRHGRATITTIAVTRRPASTDAHRQVARQARSRDGRKEG